MRTGVLGRGEGWMFGAGDRDRDGQNGGGPSEKWVVPRGRGFGV